MQEYLAAAEPQTPISGIFDATTLAALEAFQVSRGLPLTGVTDAATWPALLALTPVPVSWSTPSAADRRPTGPTGSTGPRPTGADRPTAATGQRGDGATGQRPTGARAARPRRPAAPRRPDLRSAARGGARQRVERRQLAHVEGEAHAALAAGRARARA